MINRIIIIGNGFDLAHGLKTSYADFIYQYWKEKYNNTKGRPELIPDPLIERFNGNINNIQNAIIEILGNDFYMLKDGKDILEKLFSNNTSIKRLVTPFFYILCQNVSQKNWVDIEESYYQLVLYQAYKKMGIRKQEPFPIHEITNNIPIGKLNEQLEFIGKKLKDYLWNATENAYSFNEMQSIFKESIEVKDIDPSKFNLYIEYCKELASINQDELVKYWTERNVIIDKANQTLQDFINSGIDIEKYVEGKFGFGLEQIVFPYQTLFLNFNYTNIADLYKDCISNVSVIHIHGRIHEDNSLIFGYGDEKDDDFKLIQNTKDNEFLQNFKSIRYLESERYKNLLKFIESAPYQIFILGHSCGNSDRTLLNILFEHKNCLSIKPYYHKKDKKDNYLDIIQNMSRNFTDMKLMRSRVVNKNSCCPLPQLKDSKN